MTHLEDSSGRTHLRTDDPSGAGYLPGCGEAVPIDGVDTQATRRAHMREMTMARQAAERRAAQTTNGPGRPDQAARAASMQARRVALKEELAHIEAEHQEWLQAHSGQA